MRPQLRIGVNSGPAVVGKVQGGSDAAVTVLGDTVNVAARLQVLAEPGTALMSESTHRFVHGLVEASSFGQRQMKASPIRRRPIGLTPSERGRRGLTPRFNAGSRPTSDATANWRNWSSASTRSAPASRSSTLLASPASASRAFCMNSSGRS